MRRILFLLAALLMLLVFPASAAAPAMVSPVGQPMIVTSPQGWRIHPFTGQRSYHAGVDLGVDYGDPIYAAAAGTVSYAGWMQGYGYTVMIHHGGSLYTLYGHNQRLLVSEGQSVPQGMQIAEAGSTGNSTGPHCHFEVLPNGVYGEPVDPGLYIPGLLALEQAQGGGLGLGRGLDFHGQTKDWEVVNDFAKPVSDLVNKIVGLITTGLDLLQNYVAKLFFVLVAIDLAIGGMSKAMTPPGEDSEGLFKWLMRRSLFYGFCLVLLYNWGDFVGNLSLHGFPTLGGLAGGSSEAAEAAVSDPTKIVQKGMNIIAPVFNGVLHAGSAADVLKIVLGGGGSVLLMLLCALILFLLFCLIGSYIALAYIEFYATILFSFAVFPLAGLKHVRHFSANGINSVFAASINLMFFCLFAAMLQATMEHITVGELMAQTVQAQPAGSGTSVTENISGRPKAELAYRIAQIMQERYGRSLPPAWIWAQLALESGHFTSSLAVEDHNYGGIKASPGAKIAGISPEGDYYRHFDSDEEYAQYAASNYNAYAEDGIYRAKNIQEFAAALKHGGYFGSSLESYTSTLVGILGGSSGMVQQAAANNILLLQLILVVLMYMYFADRISKLVHTQFGGTGFSLSKRQGMF